jgi:hypothetical protein
MMAARHAAAAAERTAACYMQLPYNAIHRRAGNINQEENV